ncbi:hypothetical protein [Nocardiopsis sp. CC223A]|uniref:hypothetical protein n=1 Tax=Nocardiopsis sp. CC223A TaxID=3044051 RepID=UPI00278C7AB4|nr:hypothetical protein [Nocardiopsis sp. CC223A]
MPHRFGDPPGPPANTCAGYLAARWGLPVSPPVWSIRQREDPLIQAAQATDPKPPPTDDDMGELAHLIRIWTTRGARRAA